MFPFRLWQRCSLSHSRGARPRPNTLSHEQARGISDINHLAIVQREERVGLNVRAHKEGLVDNNLNRLNIDPLHIASTSSTSLKTIKLGKPGCRKGQQRQELDNLCHLFQPEVSNVSTSIRTTPSDLAFTKKKGERRRATSASPAG